MIGRLLRVHHLDTIGAPFRVELVDSVLATDDGVTMPAPDDLVTAVAMERLHEARRLGGADLAFVRHCARIESTTLADAAGLSAEDVAAHEDGTRAMTTATEKFVRLYLYDRLRRRRAGDRTEEMLAYLDWILETWRAAPVEAGDQVMRLAHQAAHGWRRLP